MTIQAIILLIIGPSGRYLRGKWEPDEVLYRLLLSAQICVSRTVAVHVINGHKPFRDTYTKIYRRDHGITLLEDDLIAFAKGYHSTAMVRDIQSQVHTAVAASDWSAAQIAALDHHYVAVNPSRDQVAVYIAHVMYAAITCS